MKRWAAIGLIAAVVVAVGYSLLHASSQEEWLRQSSIS
jgi:uncharacterized membrane protein YukC